MFGGDDLDRRDRLAGGALALGVHLPGGVEGQQAGLVDFHPRGGDRTPARTASRPAGRRRLRARWRGGTSSRGPARRCRSPACSGGCAPGRAGPGRPRSPPRARRAGWRRVPGSLRSGSRSGRGRSSWPITGIGRTRLKPGASVGHADHRGARVGMGVGVGDDHRDRQLGADRAGGEPLVAVDHPLVAVEDRRAPAAGSGRSRRPRARSSRSRSGSVPPAAGRASAPAARRCRARRGSPCCRCPARRS